MTEIIGITSSFFAVIALGAFTKLIGLFDEKSSQIFSNFAFYIASFFLDIIHSNYTFLGTNP
jgi:predicted permease